MRSMRFPFTNIFTGPNAGAPDPSITVTPRISRDPYGPVCSAALASCAQACGAQSKAAAHTRIKELIIILVIIRLSRINVFSSTKLARLVLLSQEVQH
jgi:hypothetical protein